MIVRTMCATVAMLVSAGAVMAAERDFGSVGMFRIAASESGDEVEHRCWIASDAYEGEGETELLLVRETGDPDLVTLAVTNSSWSSKKGATYEVNYVFDTGVYDRTAFGVELDYKKGLGSRFPANEFLASFAASKGLRITMGDKVVDSLSLAGSAAAVTRFRTCYAWADAQARSARLERDRLSHITKDPFADK